MWTKTGCSYCYNAMQLLEQNKVPYAMHEIDSWPERERVRNALLEYTKLATLPNIFIGTKHIGGYTELRKLADSGELQKMMKEEKPKEPTSVVK